MCVICVLYRVCFIPLFLICNAVPDARHLTSVLLESDTAYIIIMSLFSFSNGYVGSICMICAPQVSNKMISVYVPVELRLIYNSMRIAQFKYLKSKHC